MTMDKQRERLGSAKKTAPRDNLDLDVMDALAQGYGVHYGDFKKDHPFTKDANEERLKPPKRQTAGTKPTTRTRLVYVNTCPTCLKEFTTTNKAQKYCCCEHQKKRNNAAWRTKNKKKE